jgi:hypothetical protein
VPQRLAWQAPVAAAICRRRPRYEDGHQLAMSQGPPAPAHAAPWSGAGAHVGAAAAPGCTAADPGWGHGRCVPPAARHPSRCRRRASTPLQGGGASRCQRVPSDPRSSCLHSIYVLNAFAAHRGPCRRRSGLDVAPRAQGPNTHSRSRPDPRPSSPAPYAAGPSSPARWLPWRWARELYQIALYAASGQPTHWGCRSGVWSGDGLLDSSTARRKRGLLQAGQGRSACTCSAAAAHSRDKCPLRHRRRAASHLVAQGEEFSYERLQYQHIGTCLARSGLPGVEKPRHLAFAQSPSSLRHAGPQIIFSRGTHCITGIFRVCGAAGGRRMRCSAAEACSAAAGAAWRPAWRPGATCGAGGARVGSSGHRVRGSLAGATHKASSRVPHGGLCVVSPSRSKHVLARPAHRLHWTAGRWRPSRHSRARTTHVWTSPWRPPHCSCRAPASLASTVPTRQQELHLGLDSKDTVIKNTPPLPASTPPTSAPAPPMEVAPAT